MFWNKVEPGRYDSYRLTLQRAPTVVIYHTKMEHRLRRLRPPIYALAGRDRLFQPSPYERYTRTTARATGPESKYHEAVLELYVEWWERSPPGAEDRGVLIVKCQDEVCSNRRGSHTLRSCVEYENLGFVAEDIFVVMRNNRPGVSRMARQVHARKNHSYFLVFWKRGKTRSIWEPPVTHWSLCSK